MCAPNINNSIVGRNIDTLVEARRLARQTPGSEAIIEQSNGDYTVVKLTPEEETRVRNIGNSTFEPSKVEFMMQKPNGRSEVVINPNASFLDRAQSRATNAYDSTVEIVQQGQQLLNEGIQQGQQILDQGIQQGREMINNGIQSVREMGNNLLTRGDQARQNMMNTISTLVDNLTDANNDYVWGGRGANAFNPERGISNVDCSGLVSGVMQRAGLNVDSMTTTTIDTAIRDGRGVLRQNNNASQMKPGDIINYPPGGRFNRTGHVMIATEAPKPVIRDGQTVGYRVMTFDSAPDNSGSRRANNDPEFGRRGAGYREIFLFTDSSGNVTGLNTMGSESRGPGTGYHDRVRIGTVKDDVQLK